MVVPKIINIYIDSIIKLTLQITDNISKSFFGTTYKLTIFIFTLKIICIHNMSKIRDIYVQIWRWITSPKSLSKLHINSIVNFLMGAMSLKWTRLLWVITLLHCNGEVAKFQKKLILTRGGILHILI